MNTLADIKTEASTPAATFTDHATPEGFFGTTVRFLGIVTTYLLKGDKDDLNAPIVGRVEILTSGISAYKGTSLKGGLILAKPDSYEKAFASIAK
jgi:hypothetical protein